MLKETGRQVVPGYYVASYWAEEDAFNQRKNAAVARANANFEARMRR
jgi:hypothetical protein